MTSEDIRLVVAVALPCFTVLVGILLNNYRLNDVNNRIADVNARIAELRTDLNRRFDDLIRLMEARFELQEQSLLRVFQVMDVRIKHLEER